ncbi:DUF6542 domain-containing protein [Streptomyces sp. NPDC056943]|uniref:DUF6542 domain-containing protein n=1 Tax=Streptomyces sp. NPDC056943 TaxID=3345971 RepID=UPI003642DACB
MEQHRTSQPRGRRRPQNPVTPPVTPPGALVEGALVEGAAVEGVAVYRATGRAGRAGAAGSAVPARGSVRPPGARPVPPVVLALRRLPSPRLTGLGAGLFASAVMLVIGFLDRLILDGSPLVFGLLFLPVSALTALWVRTADLVTAPISVPIAFAVGVVPIAGGTGGLGGQAMAVVTALAVHAGWLYGGTLVAGLITSVRKVRDMGRRQQQSGGGAGAGTGGGRVASGAAGEKPSGRPSAPGRRPVA